MVCSFTVALNHAKEELESLGSDPFPTRTRRRRFGGALLWLSNLRAGLTFVAKESESWTDLAWVRLRLSEGGKFG